MGGEVEWWGRGGVGRLDEFAKILACGISSFKEFMGQQLLVGKLSIILI